jgi:2-phospho-L-lactate guanylyltransferase (CobY/MobA/RfbA family)
MNVQVLRSRNLGLDLDTPEDLELFRELTRPESTPE